MGFSNQERINTNTAALQGSTLDANASAVWYEKIFNFQFSLPSDKVWTQFTSIPEANDLATAQSNAAANPTIISNLSAAANAVRLTEIAGTNDSTYAAYSTYDDLTTSVLGNWIQPQQITQRSGASAGQPSFGYGMVLYDGDPTGAPGTFTVIGPSAGTTGTGSSKTVGWIFNYSLGLLLLSADFYTETGISAAAFNPHVIGFRYIGTVAGSGGSSSSAGTIVQSFVCDETISAGEVVRLVSQVDSPTFTNPGRIVKSIATTVQPQKYRVLGVANSAGTAGVSIEVVFGGARDLLFAAAPTAADIGKPIYLSATVAGQTTLTAPTAIGDAVIKLGMLLAGDSVDTSPKCKIDIELIAVID
jgi:hypothetical protein